MLWKLQLLLLSVCSCKRLVFPGSWVIKYSVSNPGSTSSFFFVSHVEEKKDKEKKENKPSAAGIWGPQIPAPDPEQTGWFPGLKSSCYGIARETHF